MFIFEDNCDDHHVDSQAQVIHVKFTTKMVNCVGATRSGILRGG
jgi:hypothetical protein